MGLILSLHLSNKAFDSNPSQISAKQEDSQGTTGRTLAEQNVASKQQKQQGHEEAVNVPLLEGPKQQEVPHLETPKQQNVSHPKVKKQQGHEETVKETVKVPHLEVQKVVYSVVKELWEIYDLGEGPKVLTGMPLPRPSQLFLQTLTCSQHITPSTRHSYCKVRPL